MTVDDQVSPDAVTWAARRTVAMHDEGSRCAQCVPGGGCPQLAWALHETAALPVPDHQPPPYPPVIS